MKLKVVLLDDVMNCMPIHRAKHNGEIMENMKEAVELAVEDLGNTGDFNMLIVQKHND